MPWTDLPHWTLAIAFPALVMWTMAAFVETTGPMNVPGIFWGKWGRAFHAALAVSVAIFGISGLWWMFKIFPWFVPPLLVVIFCPVGNFLYQALPRHVLRGLPALILGTIGLFVLHWTAWGYLRPP